jgi:hypothetical protein
MGSLARIKHSVGQTRRQWRQWRRQPEAACLRRLRRNGAGKDFGGGITSRRRLRRRAAAERSGSGARQGARCPSRRRVARINLSSNTPPRELALLASPSLHRRPNAFGACQRQKASANGLRPSPPRRLRPRPTRHLLPRSRYLPQDHQTKTRGHSTLREARGHGFKGCGELRARPP